MADCEKRFAKSLADIAGAENSYAHGFLKMCWRLIHMAAITLTVNGKRQTVDVDPTTPLLYILRNDLDLSGPRFGCGLGQCGACSVIINGAAVRSCVTPVSAVKGEITTLEGLATNGSLHPVQQAWIDEQVPACGFCQNGQIITAKVLLDKNPNPTDQQIREGMAGALCRCMTYYRVQAAIKRAAETMRSLPRRSADASVGAKAGVGR
jgi:aerobic-type carbon monoxide dehydrogenase small subunit (CoxS/CutS family)